MEIGSYISNRRDLLDFLRVRTTSLKNGLRHLKEILDDNFLSRKNEFRGYTIWIIQDLFWIYHVLYRGYFEPLQKIWTNLGETIKRMSYYHLDRISASCWVADRLERGLDEIIYYKRLMQELLDSFRDMTDFLEKRGLGNMVLTLEGIVQDAEEKFPEILEAKQNIKAVLELFGYGKYIIDFLEKLKSLYTEIQEYVKLLPKLIERIRRIIRKLRRDVSITFTYVESKEVRPTFIPGIGIVQFVERKRRLVPVVTLSKRKNLGLWPIEVRQYKDRLANRVRRKLRSLAQKYEKPESLRETICEKSSIPSEWI